jgi:hypothetical protein
MRHSWFLQRGEGRIEKSERLRWSKRTKIVVGPVRVNADETAVDQVDRGDPSLMKALVGSLDRFRGTFDELFFVWNLGPLGDVVGACGHRDPSVPESIA